MAIVYLLVVAFVIVLDYYISKWFCEVAEEKGYPDTKYFWICFLLGSVGYLLVVAMPDRGKQKNEIVSDELPAL